MFILSNYAYFSGFLGFFLLGYLLGRVRMDPKWILPIWLLIPVWAGLETLFMHSQTKALKVMPDQWFDTLTVLVAPYTVLMFLGLKGLGERIQAGLSESSKWPRIFEALSHASFGIILIHVVVLEYMYNGVGSFHLAPYDFHPALSVPIVSIVGYLICLGLVYILQKIPLVREIVPE
jgi:surface polysaccharide O-acyltransferase-like enzyme